METIEIESVRMPFEAADVEAEALAVYQATNADPNDPPSILRLARGYPGIAEVTFCAQSHGAELVSNDNGDSTIRLRRGLSHHALGWLLAHELQEHRFRRRVLPYIDDDRELLINACAAATIVPRVGLRAATRLLGFDLPALADVFGSTQTIVALRIGEALEHPVAIVRTSRARKGSRIIRRGPNDLPRDRLLSRLVADGGNADCSVVWLSDVDGVAAVIGSKPDW